MLKLYIFVFAISEIHVHYYTHSIATMYVSLFLWNHIINREANACHFYSSMCILSCSYYSIAIYYFSGIFNICACRLLRFVWFLWLISIFELFFLCVHGSRLPLAFCTLAPPMAAAYTTGVVADLVCAPCGSVIPTVVSSVCSEVNRRYKIVEIMWLVI